MQLEILSGGAAQGLVAAVTPQFKAETGFDIGGSFGAVGAMRDKLLAGAPADVLILTAALIAELAGSGHAVAGSAADVGVVRTAIAVRSGDASPSVGGADGLRAALLAADAIYLPDPKLATAGIHFAKVLDRLGIRDAVAGRLRPYPNGATAMREMASAQGLPDRMHAGDRDPQHAGRNAGGAPAEGVRAGDHLHRRGRRWRSFARAGPPPRRPAERGFDATPARARGVRGGVALLHPSSRNSRKRMSGTRQSYPQCAPR
jgi:hypothetical protein